MIVRPLRVDQLDAVEIRDGDLAVTVVPELGGKLCSIVWEGRELLARNRLRPAQYEASYADFDASGFDECLPTIGACEYPEEPWLGTVAPDHGEVWSVPWSWSHDRDRLHLAVSGVRFPYRFEKSIELHPPGAIRLNYALTNEGGSPFRYLWSAHPLLAPCPGMRIHLPLETRVCVDWSKGERLGGAMTEHPWPLTRDRLGQEVDLGLILTRDSGHVEKLYTNRLTEGWCAVHDPEDGFYVAATFPVERVPYVGLSINLGGWPVDRPAYFNLGLEPCNGFPDRLDIAAVSGVCAVAAPGERQEWNLDFHIGRCHDLQARIPELRESSLAA